MLTPKQAYASVKWANSRNRADKAANTLAKHGFSYDSKGLIGEFNRVTKKEKRKIEAAGTVLQRNNAIFSVKRQTFSNSTTVRSAHYEALNLSETDKVQIKSIKQSKTSMHLRAAQKFLQRVLYDPRIQSHPNRRALRITPEEAQEWSAMTESFWRQDKESKSWDEAEKNDYSQMSDMALWLYLHVGEFFAVVRAYNDDPERTANLSIQIFHPLQIQSPFFGTGFFSRLTFFDCNTLIETTTAQFLTDLKKGHYIEGGIEYDNKDREISIFICPVVPGDPWQKIPFKNSAGMPQVLHGFIQQEPGQRRGIPEGAYSWHEYMKLRK